VSIYVLHITLTTYIYTVLNACLSVYVGTVLQDPDLVSTMCITLLDLIRLDLTY